MPLARLTPIASRTVTIKKQAEMMKTAESIPERKPMDVQSDETSAECAEGMLPVRQMSSSNSSPMLRIFPLNNLMTVLMTCALSQLNTHAKNTGEEKSCCT